MLRGIIAKWGMLAVVFFLIAACGEVGGSGQCGGAENTGLCLRIEKIVPNDFTQDTSNVDAFQEVCNAFAISTATTPVEPIYEKMTDHQAKITVSNRPLQNLTKEDISDVTLLNFSVEYTLNRCPDRASCPVLPVQIVNPGETVLIPAMGSVEFELPFVPLATKTAYEDRGGSKGAYPSYTATYTITGTDSFTNKVSVRGSAEFTIGDYHNCS